MTPVGYPAMMASTQRDSFDRLAAGAYRERLSEFRRDAGGVPGDQAVPPLSVGYGAFMNRFSCPATGSEGTFPDLPRHSRLAVALAPVPASAVPWLWRLPGSRAGLTCPVRRLRTRKDMQWRWRLPRPQGPRALPAPRALPGSRAPPAPRAPPARNRGKLPRSQSGRGRSRGFWG